jgi:hypothetical protein
VVHSLGDEDLIGKPTVADQKVGKENINGHLSTETSHINISPERFQFHIHKDPHKSSCSEEEKEEIHTGSSSKFEHQRRKCSKRSSWSVEIDNFHASSSSSSLAESCSMSSASSSISIKWKVEDDDDNDLEVAQRAEAGDVELEWDTIFTAKDSIIR